MFRETLNEDSTDAMTGYAKSGPGEWLYRNLQSTRRRCRRPMAPPCALLGAAHGVGNVITGEQSADGRDVGRLAPNIDHDVPTIYVGLTVSTHNNAELQRP